MLKHKERKLHHLPENSSAAANKFTPSQAAQLLAQDGLIVSEEQARIILEFLYEMAEIVVDQYLSTLNKDADN